MKKRRQRRWLLAAGAILLYLGLCWLLVAAESQSPEAAIRSLPLALWYSVTTLTTVGYGDLYPVTPAGRIIGFLFQLMSLGVLAAVVSLILKLIQGRLIPRLQLAFSQKKNWYFFNEANEAGLKLAARLREKEADCLILLPQEALRQADPALQAVGVDWDAAYLCEKKKQKDGLHVFFLGDNYYENEKQAQRLAGSGCRVYYQSDHEPEQIPPSVICFQPEESAARLYWHNYPLRSARERIVLVGGGRFGRNLLEQGLLLNVVDPEQSVRYDLCGDWSEFFREHPYVDQFLDLNPERPARDALFCRPEPWNSDWMLFKQADRIVFCGDDEAENAADAAVLLRCCPVQGAVYVRLSHPMDRVISFGGPDELYVPEVVMDGSLNRLAAQMHENYRASSPSGLPDWNGLGAFLRRSNAASADHLFMKARILLGEDAGAEPENWAKAGALFEALPEDGKRRCRRIEHERWNRFHLLNNWQYGPVRDNAARIHPLIRPFDELSREDQAKDDYAWQLLTQAGEILTEE